jgi:hypothetical protein
MQESFIMFKEELIKSKEMQSHLPLTQEQPQ